jgi:hypothetical protein
MIAIEGSAERKDDGVEDDRASLGGLRELFL